MGCRILSIIKQEGINCLPCDRVNLDIERFAEYRDSDEHPAEIPFERPLLSTSKKRIIESESRTYFFAKVQAKLSVQFSQGI